MNCPKCGGSAGFMYNLTIKTNRIGDWGEDDDEEVEVERIRDVKTVTCIDCKKRVDWDIAHGLTRAAELPLERNTQQSGASIAANEESGK